MYWLAEVACSCGSAQDKRGPSGLQISATMTHLVIEELEAEPDYSKLTVHFRNIALYVFFSPCNCHFVYIS